VLEQVILDGAAAARAAIKAPMPAIVRNR